MVKETQYALDIQISHFLVHLSFQPWSKEVYEKTLICVKTILTME